MDNTTSLIYAVGIIVLFLALMVWNYGRFATTVTAWCKPLNVKQGKNIKKPKLETGEAVCCYLPLYQCVMVRKSLYGSAGWTLPVCITSLVLIVLRLLNAFLLPINGYVMLITTFMMWIGLLLMFVLYGAVTFQCARMYEFSTVYCVLCMFIAVLVCGRMQTAIAHKMRAMHKEATFSEHKSDTYIKSKHS